MVEEHDIGDLVRISGSFTTTALVPTDPTTLKIAIKNPAGEETVYVYGDDPEIVRDGVGAFHFDLLLTESRSWYYRWRATGAVTAVEEDNILVRDSEFATPLI